ncbi:shikimate kinase [Yinghuangia sp. ASG 101]|uniref:shikimate kinase n=1 Tax=Yinghuangia sp. ASG 101 TaxID=2896848 RepID=UPI001E3AD56C|nr:shikimate kinase [Yinghuangia sp. ASG 101]UGQ13077.1 shikimate kinase [Yinghuangia sp. ASG 101]
METPTTGPAVVLVGPPGAGKTTVGLLLAARTGTEFRDTDADVEKAAGKPIPDIFVDDGEPHFRELEHRAVAAALADHDGILALGGGAVMAAETRKLLVGHPVAFLDVELADAVRRVGLDAPRPLLIGNPRARWRELMEQRRPLYEEVATVVVPTAGRTPEQVADELLAALARPGRAVAPDTGDEDDVTKDQER